MTRLVVALGLIVPLISAEAASSLPDASLVIDRTLECSVAGVGYPESIRYLDAFADPRVGRHAPSVRVSPGSVPGGADGVHVGVRTGPQYGQPSGGIWLSRSCRQIRTRLPFATRTLRGGGADRFGERHRCDVPARVLIRIRARFAKPVTVRPDRRAPYLLAARGRILDGSIAVATSKRAPIVLATVNDTTGGARLFVSPARCFPTQ